MLAISFKTFSYYGQDIIGNEIGAGIAAGMLDGLNYRSLKELLMARGTRKISRIVSVMGGNDLTIFGLSHLGDYEATLFSFIETIENSDNRKLKEKGLENWQFNL